KFFGEAVARVANFPAKNCCPAKPGGDRKSTKGEKPQRTLRREGMKILPGPIPAAHTEIRDRN
ncbi:hypothetical protein ALC57_10489, partial [Trachymyrmex cornetzi]